MVIDGYKRVAALQQLGRDQVEAVVWPMNEAEAIVLDRSLRLSQHETALEVGWLLADLEQRFGYNLDELSRRFDRSVSWVSRRLALVEALPEGIRRQVREGKIAAQVAMKFLVPPVRISLEAYFLPVIEEVLELRMSPDYFQYIRQKLKLFPPNQ